MATRCFIVTSGSCRKIRLRRSNQTKEWRLGCHFNSRLVMKPFNQRSSAKRICSALIVATFALTLWNAPAWAQTTKKGDPPPLKICLVSGSAEYMSHESLSEFQKFLESQYNV